SPGQDQSGRRKQSKISFPPPTSEHPAPLRETIPVLRQLPPIRATTTRESTTTFLPAARFTSGFLGETRGRRTRAHSRLLSGERPGLIAPAMLRSISPHLHSHDCECGSILCDKVQQLHFQRRE